MHAMKICIFEKGSRRILSSFRFSARSMKDALNLQSEHWNQHFVLSDRRVSKLYVQEPSRRWWPVGTIYS
jgi:hypothetical protein